MDDEGLASIPQLAPLGSSPNSLDDIVRLHIGPFSTTASGRRWNYEIVFPFSTHISIYDADIELGPCYPMSCTSWTCS